MIRKPPMADYPFCKQASSPHYQSSHPVNMQRQQQHQSMRLYQQQQVMSFPPLNQYRSPGSSWTSHSSSSGASSSGFFGESHNNPLLNNAILDMLSDRSSNVGEYSLNSIINSMHSNESCSFSGMNQWPCGNSWSPASMHEQLSNINNNNNNDNNNSSRKNLKMRFSQATQQQNQRQPSKQQQQHGQQHEQQNEQQQQPKPATELKSDAFLRRAPTQWRPIDKVAEDVIDVSLAGLHDFCNNLKFKAWQSESPLMATSNKVTGGMEKYPQVKKEKNDYPNKRCKDCGFSHAPSPNGKFPERKTKPTYPLRREFKIVVDEVFDNTIESEFDFLL